MISRRPVSRRSFLVPAAVGLAGCGRNRRRIIGVIPKATSHLFFVAVHAGVDAAAREFNVEALWNGPNDETDHARQIQVLESMITRRVDAIAISATDERALASTVERAIRSGIPVAIFDSGVNVQDYITFVATGNHEAGVRAARHLAELTGGRGDLAMVMHKPGGTSTMLREQGFEETLTREFPNLRIAGRQYGMADMAKARAAAENILTANPRLAGIFASSEASSLGAIHAIKARGLAGKVKLVTFDTSDPHVEALRDGTIDVMLVQDSFSIGYQAVRALAEHLKGAAPPKRTDLPAKSITRADLEKPEIQSILFPKGVLRK
ncbi:MAG: substrate-binding domain-containing protein [Acidobacteria bacterium]|nr:substrate-binding domain-containing protein [Acidobacteriota bacterium]